MLSGHFWISYIHGYLLFLPFFLFFVLEIYWGFRLKIKLKQTFLLFLGIYLYLWLTGFIGISGFGIWELFLFLYLFIFAIIFFLFISTVAFLVGFTVHKFFSREVAILVSLKITRIYYLLSLFIISIFLYWRFIGYVPLNWQIYENNNPSAPYSFAYPKNWIITNCGNGEIVASKKPINYCEEISKASLSYQNNFYFQVFMPGQHDLLLKNDLRYSSKLSDWKTWYITDEDFGSERMVGDSIPIPKTKTTVQSNSFTVGYFTKTNEQKTIEQVLSTFNFPE